MTRLGERNLDFSISVARSGTCVALSFQILTSVKVRAGAGFQGQVLVQLSDTSVTIRVAPTSVGAQLSSTPFICSSTFRLRVCINRF